MKVTYRKGKLYFDPEAWALIKHFARKSHLSPHNTVMAALKRGIKHVTKEIPLESPPLPGSRRP